MARFCIALTLAVTLVSSSGCCWINRMFCGKKWCNSGCGEVYWNEWDSDPPYCCDPCNRCGNFTGRGLDTHYGHPHAHGPVHYGPTPTIAGPEVVDGVPPEVAY